MRKVILSMMVSLDGYMESRNPDEYWHIFDEQMVAYITELFKTVDTFIYGRKSYEAMIAYWPPLDDEFARIMNETPKLVFSRTLDHVEWNSRLIKDNVVAEMQQLKQQEGKDMVLFAGADIAETFIKNNLIDEFRLIVNPVVLGGGKPLFKNINHTMKLKHTGTTVFNCGNVLQIYEPIELNK
jgi:dihydrofolate reductase